MMEPAANWKRHLQCNYNRSVPNNLISKAAPERGKIMSQWRSAARIISSFTLISRGHTRGNLRCTRRKTA